MQRGQVIERRGQFYVRFYNGEGRMVAKWICDKDAKQHSKTCKPVRLKQQEVMLAVNSEKDVEDKGRIHPSLGLLEGDLLALLREAQEGLDAESYEDLFKTRKDCRSSRGRFNDERPDT